MKKIHKLFFAIPFDTATMKLYERIRDRILKEYPTSITIVIGNNEIGPSPEYSEIATFKAQNRELSRQFVTQIMDADIIIADLTHNNPNVHIELGIALMENKNILRVSGRSVSELGFDIRNLEVFMYHDEDELFKKIMRYLEIFLKIKGLSIPSEHSFLYFEELNVPINLTALEKNGRGRGLIFQQNVPTNFKIRDGGIRVAFEILNVRTSDDWFGVFFRSVDSPWSGSNLVYVRQNGMVEVAVYPGPEIIVPPQSGQAISGEQLLEIQFENNQLEIKMGSFSFQAESLSRQTPGRIFPAVYNANAVVHILQMICRDTIEWESFI